MAENRNLHQLAVEFFTEAKQDATETEKAGRPVFKDIPMVRIRWGGDRGRELVAPASAPCTAYDANGVLQHTTYAERFAEIYDKFQADEEQVVGVPLEMMDWISPSKRSELKGQNVRTLEQLADLPDRAVTKLGPGYRELRDEARKNLDRAKDDQAVNAMEARIRELEAKLAQAGNAPSAGDEFEAMSDEDLREYIAARGIEPRKNAARDKLIAAARQCADMEAA